MVGRCVKRLSLTKRVGGRRFQAQGSGPRGVRLAAAAVLGLLLLAPVGGAKTVEARRAPALAFLADAAPEAGTLAANVVEAVAANGLDASTWPTPDAPLARRITVPAEDAPFITLLRPLRALALAGDERADDLAHRVQAGFDGAQFGSAAQLNDDAYAILALRAAGTPGDDPAIQATAAFLRAHQNADGGWGWAVGSPSGTDLTGIVVLALQASAPLGPAESNAVAAFLATTRSGDGYAESPGGTANCESTAWALRTLARVGHEPDASAWRFLLGLQKADGGFAHLPGGAADLLCTAEAATALGEAADGLVPFTVGEGGWRIPALGLPHLVAALGATVAVAMSTRIRPT